MERMLTALEAMTEFLSDDEEAVHALAELAMIIDLLPAMGVNPERVVFDPTLARGLDYYTGPVFEATVEEPKVGSVAGGGRYENLIGSFTNRTITATGVSLGMERILEVVREFETLPQMPPSADVFVVVFPDTVQEAAALAVRLRNTGLRADLGTQPQRGVGDQLKYAARKSIPFAVIAGADELASGQVGVKNLITGEQNQVALADLESAADQFISEKRVRMIRVGNALAPRWYESNPARLDQLLDRIQAAGGTAAEFVLLPGEATAAQRRVQVPEAEWRSTVDAVLEQGNDLFVSRAARSGVFAYADGTTIAPVSRCSMLVCFSSPMR